MKFDLNIKNIKILREKNRDILALEGLLTSEFSDANSLYFGCPGKSLAISSFHKNHNGINFQTLIEIPKNEILSGIYFVYQHKEKISALGTIALDASGIEIKDINKTISLIERSPNTENYFASSKINLKSSVQIINYHNNCLHLKLNANFYVSNQLSLKLIEVSISKNKYLLPDEINFEKKGNLYFVTLSVNLKINDLSALSQIFRLKIYSNRSIIEYSSDANFFESLTLKEPYLNTKTILPKIKNSKKEKSITLILEINSLNKNRINFLRSINTYKNCFNQIILICKNTDYEYISKELLDIKILHNEKNANWIKFLSKLSTESSSTTFLFLSFNACLTEELLAFIPVLSKRNCEVFIPKIISDNGKVLEAGNFIIGNKIVYAYGRDEDKNLSKFNFEKKLLACSNSAFVFSKELITRILKYKKSFLSTYKLHDIINYLSTHENIEITYNPNFEISTKAKNDQFYHLKEIISPIVYTETPNLDKRKKILILGDLQKIYLLKDYIAHLINQNYLITIITFDEFIKEDFLLETESNSIEWITNLSTNNLNYLLKNRKEYYLSTWVLNNAILKVIKNNHYVNKIIFTPDIKNNTIGKYFKENEIFYSNLNQEKIAKPILTNSKGDIYSPSQFKDFKNINILTPDANLLSTFLENEIPINLLDENNLLLAVDSKKYFKENTKRCIDNELYNYNLTKLIKANKHNTERYAKTIDIVLPIYNSYESAKLCIESIFKASDLPFNLYLVNDSSTDNNIIKLIKDTKKKEGENLNKEIIVIENQVNLGYTKNVNLCMAITENDLLLINSDCILPNNCLSKLFHPIFTEANIATVSPLTNDNSILSLVDENEIFKSTLRDIKNLDLINSLLSKTFNNKYSELPTGVGYCMAIARNAIELFGQYDSELFPKMYGEENDFSIRALQSGFKNVLVHNMFAYHYESLSEKESSSACKTQLKEKAISNLNLVYEKYDQFVSSSSLLNHLSQIKKFIKMLLVTQSSKKEFLLIVHNPELKGGSFEFIKDLKQRYSNKFNYLYLLADKDQLSITYFNDNLSNNEISIDFNWNEVDFNIGILLKTLNVTKVFVNQIFNMQMKKIIPLLQEIDISYDYITHDFYSVCPSITLTNEKGLFCGLETNVNNCAKCLEGKFKNRKELHNPIFISEWREIFYNFLKNADNVYSPSEDTLKKYQVYYPDINYKIFKYRDNPFIQYVNDINTIHQENFHIAIIGAISDEKGLKLLDALYDWIKENNKNIKITVVGYTSNHLNAYQSEDGLYRITGPYNPINISNILKEVNPDLLLGISLMAETYSYTTREGIYSGFPILNFDQGPAANLIRDNLEFGWLTNYGNFESLRDKIEYLSENREKVVEKSLDLQKHLENFISFSYKSSKKRINNSLLNIVENAN